MWFVGSTHWRALISLDIRFSGVEKAMNMPPPPLWRAPTPPSHVPTIGGYGAFVRPLRPDADGMARHHSLDLDRAPAGAPRGSAPVGSGCSPVLPRRFSAEEVVGGRLPPLRLEDPLSLVASETVSPQRSPHHRSPQRSPTLRATGAASGPWSVLASARKALPNCDSSSLADPWVLLCCFMACS